MKRALLALSLVVFFTGCAKKAVAEGEHAETHAEHPPIGNGSTNRMSWGEFFEPLYVQAYNDVGRKDPKWDEAATAFLAILSKSVVTQTENPDMRREMAARLEAVRATECKDPLVRYMILRQTQDPHYPGENGTNDWVQVALDLEASGYHPYWKFYSHMRAAQALKAHALKSDKTYSPPEVQEFRDKTSRRLLVLVQDFTVPAEVMFDAANQWINNELARVPNTRKWTYEMVEPTIMQGWGDTAEAHLIRGSFFILHAWDARGGGWASEVTDDDWKLMGVRLQIARESLQRSWKIKPRDEAAEQMIWVETGDSHGREAMELWFTRAMELNPANYTACSSKLNWLLPKWHGSARDLIAFGRECLTNRNGKIPLILYVAHQELATYYRQTERGTEEEYWKRSEVWPDVKDSFEAFFEANPGATGWRHDYARAAYRAEAWTDLRKQIPLLTEPINYKFFGGREKFEELVRKAEELGQE